MTSYGFPYHGYRSFAIAQDDVLPLSSPRQQILFNGAKYIAERNVPDPSAGAYHYVPWGREEAGSLKEVPKFTVPKIMAPPSLRMPPAVTRPVPFESTEARKRREEMEKRVVCTVERPTPEEKKEKGLFVKLRKWI